MAGQQSLPPTPPLTKEGFASTTWQQWLEILRRRLAESFNPGNLPPPDLAALTTVDVSAAFFQLQKAAVSQKRNAILKNLEVLETLLVDGTSHLVGDVQMDGKLTVHLKLTTNADVLVGGNTQLNGTLRAIGNIHADGNLQLDGGAAVNGNLISGAFGCNGQAAQPPVALGTDATDLATALVLVNAIRAALVADGIGS